MKYANTFKQELSLLKSGVVESIETNLKRIGRTLKEQGEDQIDFFSFKTTSQLEIEAINADGTFVGTDGTIRGYIEDDLISLEDAVDLLEDLEQI
jgi:ribosomal protein S1